MLPTPHRFVSGDRNNIALIFPHWGASRRSRSYWFLRSAFNALGYMSISYFYPEETLCPDIENTRERFMAVEALAHSDCQTLGSRIKVIYGASLGTTWATRVANRYANTPVTRLILNLSGASFPYAVWNGASTKHIRAGFEQKDIWYIKFRDALDCYSPIHNLQNLAGTRILFMPSLNDSFICRENVLAMIEELKGYPRVRIAPSKLGHKSAGVVNMFRLGLLPQFLK